MLIHSLVIRNRGKFEITIALFCIVLIYHQHSSSSSYRHDIEHYDQLVRKFQIERRKLRESKEAMREALEDVRETATVQQALSLKLEALQKENQKLKNQLQASKTFTNFTDSLASGSLTDQNLMQDELRKRRIRNDVLELRYSIKAMFKRDLKSETIDGEVQRILQQITSALIDADNVVDANSEWKRKEMEKLQEIMRKRIDHLQNPIDCEKARKLICSIHESCGFGCQLHHLSSCFMIAYGTQRTLIIESENWSYSKAGWESFFQPVSRTCHRKTTQQLTFFRDEESTKDALEVLMKPIRFMQNNLPPYVPVGVPTEFVDKLKTIHGVPGVWWVGQFIKYLLRPADRLRIELEKYEAAVDYSKPIIGIHVRRTDKRSEAAFHDIEEYMEHVDEWYEQHEIKHGKGNHSRRVYLATDDPQVVAEAKTKYPNYNFIHSTEFSRNAQVGSRYSTGGLLGVVADIHLLSKSNYIVCTFSSQVCRVAYELMQTLHTDASSYFHSLDDVYFYAGGSAHVHVAVYEHEPGPGEIQLRVGDVIGVQGNHWNGYSKGTNQRDGKTGLFPSYKVQDVIKLVNYPTFSTVY